MTFFALAAKWGLRGASGFSASSLSAANSRSFNNEASPTVPSPTPQSLKNCRRVRYLRNCSRRFMASPSTISPTYFAQNGLHCVCELYTHTPTRAPPSFLASLPLHTTSVLAFIDIHNFQCADQRRR